jgi:hypothetical protein
MTQPKLSQPLLTGVIACPDCGKYVPCGSLAKHRDLQT